MNFGFVRLFRETRCTLARTRLPLEEASFLRKAKSPALRERAASQDARGSPLADAPQRLRLGVSATSRSLSSCRHSFRAGQMAQAFGRIAVRQIACDLQRRLREQSALATHLRVRMPGDTSTRGVTEASASVRLSGRKIRQRGQLHARLRSAALGPDAGEVAVRRFSSVPQRRGVVPDLSAHRICFG
jgi:hypothetical protein